MRLAILTDSFLLIEADSALALALNDTARVEYVVTLEHPDLLSILSEVKAQTATIAPVAPIDDNALAEVGMQRSRVILCVTGVQRHGWKKDRLCVALLLELVMKRLLEFFELHNIALFFKVCHDLIQVHILTHVLNHFLIPRA